MVTAAPSSGNQRATITLTLEELNEVIEGLHNRPSANPELLTYLYNKRRNLTQRVKVRDVH